MSGWIKLEKDLRDDPRFLRMVRSYRNSYVTQERISERTAVTHLLGAVANLWMYADSHVREDDTLDLGPGEINELVGIEGFAELMPTDWLEVIDTDRVKLPGFQGHNGTEAKKKALTAKRVERHRIRNVTQESSPIERSSNAPALPDQTRPDQTRPEDRRVPSEPVEPSSTAKPDAKTESVQRVFDHWRDIHRKPRAQLDPKRRKLIRGALGAYSEADLCQAISGYLNSPHHMGQNDRSTVYDSIELMLRDAEHIDAGLKFHVEPPQTNLSDKTRRMVAATENWEPPEVRRATN